MSEPNKAISLASAVAGTCLDPEALARRLASGAGERTGERAMSGRDANGNWHDDALAKLDLELLEYGNDGLRAIASVLITEVRRLNGRVEQLLAETNGTGT